MNINIISEILLWEILKGLAFIKFSNEILIKNRVSKFGKILGISVFVLFNCFSYLYLYQVDQFLPRILFVVACLIYLSIFYINEIKDILVVSFTYYITFYQKPEKEFYLEVLNTADIDKLKMKDGVLETTKEDKSS